MARAKLAGAYMLRHTPASDDISHGLRACTGLASSCYCRCDTREWSAAAALGPPRAAVSLASFAFWKRSQRSEITPQQAQPVRSSLASGIRHVVS